LIPPSASHCITHGLGRFDLPFSLALNQNLNQLICFVEPGLGRPRSRPKIFVDKAPKISESEGRVMVIALKASLNIYLQDLMAGKKNNENKE